MTTKTKKAKPATKKTAPKATKKVATAKAAKATAPKAENGKSKRDICRAMLTRAAGATSKQLCEATGWKAISVPPLARALKLKLTSKPNENGAGVVYFAKA